MRRLLLRLATGLLVLAGGLSPLALPAPAHAGQVGVTLGIQGAGIVWVVEGSLEDNASRECNKLMWKDDREISWCPRVRNSEPFEAWIWLRPEVGTLPGWRFAGWTGCDQLRTVDEVEECGVHSGAFNSVERQPVAIFDDVEAPRIESLTLQPVAGVQGTVRAAFKSTDYDVLQCRVDDGAWSGCASGHQVTAAPGDHSFTLRASDYSGNDTDAVRPFAVVDTRIVSGPPTPTRSTEAAFSLAGENATGFDCSLDGTPFICGGSITLTGLTEGSHAVTVAGRKGSWVDEVPATWTWTVDTTPPVTTLQAPEVSGRAATFRFDSPGATRTECRHTAGGVAGAWAACTSPVAYANLAPGDHVFAVRGVDAAGNVESTGPSHVWTVAGTPGDPGTPGGPGTPGDPGTPGGPSDPGSPDRTPPLTTLTGPADGAVLLGAPVVTLGASEQATFLCTVDGRAWGCASGAQRLALTPGSHVLTVRARDAAGNLDGRGVTRTWTVPVPAAQLHGRGWRLSRSKPAYSGSVLRSTRRGATLVRSVTGARRVVLVASTGKRLGVVKVYAGRRLVGRVRTAGPTGRRLVTVRLARPFTGKLRLQAASGRSVRLEGLAVVTR